MEAYYSVQLAMARVLLIVICGGWLSQCVSSTDTVCCGSCSDTSEVALYVRSSGDHLFTPCIEGPILLYVYCQLCMHYS